MGIPEEADPQMEEMEMEGIQEMDPYGMEDDQMEEMDEEQDQEIGYDDLIGVIEKTEDKSKAQAMQVTDANYISKGTYIYQLLTQIMTGEQAISFFAKHGHNTPIKFVNCKRKEVSGDQFRPYDLVKIDGDEKALEGEYFTISAQGVVQIIVDRAKKNAVIPTEFLSLSEWMQQSTMFNVLTSMKFFKHYIIGKVFALWKGNVRFKMFNRTRQNLAKNLIFMRPAFLSSYMEVNKSLFEMQTKKTFWVPSGSKQYELTEFFNNDQKS